MRFPAAGLRADGNYPSLPGHWRGPTKLEIKNADLQGKFEALITSVARRTGHIHNAGSIPFRILCESDRGGLMPGVVSSAGLCVTYRK